MTRLSTGIEDFDKLIEGGIPEGFLVALTGEPGTGKTIFSISFIYEGLKEGDIGIYVTTEESRDSIIKQAKQFNMNLEDYLDKKLIIIDALMKEKEDPWSINEVTPEEMVQKVIEAKQKLGYGRARLTIDSISAFFLDKPAMARKISYYIKRVLYKWKFTILITSQYAITTSQAFGFGVEHVADGIIRFRRVIKDGMLHRYVNIEKMRQTNHDKYVWEIDIKPGKGLVLLGKLNERREDYSLPRKTMEHIRKSNQDEI
ncbi:MULTISPECIES: KaiC domain-containing protein [Acidianus]|uniref:Circadian clock protein KaiC n=1 Tax=Candidatus Acidianus copahuensis TaxID=1160895 RepID=A0A031LVI2_9CREN|nr:MULTISPECIES: KaiC domain-containing protein [Acidianus]EZQ11118.1 circadian clock protein KaiC [Candidatus Acidianus copahuensis]NON62505.1 KaiC domain-containing protein [Acidianus sp. RZ1]